MRYLRWDEQGVVDALAALEIMLMQQPRLSGRFSSTPYHIVAQPLHGHFSSVMNRLVQPLEGGLLPVEFELEAGLALMSACMRISVLKFPWSCK